MPGSRQFVYVLIIGAMILVACSQSSNPVPDQGNIVPPEEQFTGVIQDEFEGESVVIYGNSEYQVLVAYSRTSITGKTLDFQLSDQLFPDVFEDNEGTTWNIFGEAVAGPGAGDKLQPIIYQVGYWFSFATFFPLANIYGEAESERIVDDFNSSEWLINPDDLKQGALREAIPSIDAPEFIMVDLLDEGNAPYDDDDLMVVMNDNAIARVYPHPILDWHEIVNDTFDGENIVVSYCPLTGTSGVWQSNITGNETFEFGVSGLLYNSNLVLYDRNTENLWSQILGRSINGHLINSPVTYVNSIEMNWAGIKGMGMQTKILSQKSTGVDRSYDRYPYKNYKTSSVLLFPVTNPDLRIHPKERVLAIIINDKTKVYQFEHFPKK
jgi:Protein of unknown function (DUF3179)